MFGNGEPVSTVLSGGFLCQTQHLIVSAISRCTPVYNRNTSECFGCVGNCISRFDDINRIAVTANSLVSFMFFIISYIKEYNKRENQKQKDSEFCF